MEKRTAKNNIPSGNYNSTAFALASWAFASAVDTTNRSDVSLEEIELTKVKEEKRFGAAKSYIARMLKGEKLFPAIGTPTKEDILNFARCCSLFLYSYDTLNRMYRMTLAASIWIIRAVSEVDRYEELLPLLADEKDIPDYYDSELFTGVYIPESNRDVIRRLNFMLDACCEDGETDPYGILRTLTSEAAVKGPRRYAAEIRKIVKLIPKPRVENAVSGYRRAVCSWTGSLLSATRVNKPAPYHLSPAAEDRPLPESLPEISDPRTRALKRKLRRFQALDYAALFYDPISWASSYAGTTPEKLAEQNEDYRALVDFSVGDPYEYCFAFIYLLQKDDELIWLYWLNATPLMKAAAGLPWCLKTYTETYRKIAPETVSASLEGIVKFFAGPRKSSSLPDETQSNVLETALFLTTGAVYRSDAALSSVDSMEDILKAFCFENLKLQIPLPLFASILQSLIPGKTFCLLPEDIPDDSTGKSEEVPAPDEQVPAEDSYRTVQKLESDLSLAKRENSSLKSELSSVNKDRRSISAKLQKLQEEDADKTYELARLRELLFPESIDQSVQASPEEEEIKFPVKLNRKIYVCGGHESFIKELKKLLPDIRIIGPAGDPKEGAIAHADYIWFQANCLSHKTYDKAVASAKKYNIPYGYFKFSSAKDAAIRIYTASAASS